MKGARPHRAAVRAVDELLDRLELEHRAGRDDAGWVVDYWRRQVAPRVGVDLPADVRAARNACETHQALLGWQHLLIERA